MGIPSSSIEEGSGEGGSSIFVGVGGRVKERGPSSRTSAVRNEVGAPKNKMSPIELYDGRFRSVLFRSVQGKHVGRPGESWD